MSAPQILIVGAGPTGLNLALRLAHHGVAFRIIDKNSGPGEASRALAVHARTLEFYRQLGFADEVVSHGIRIGTVHVHENAKEVARVNLNDMGGDLSPFPFMLGFPQDDHERLLLGKLTEAGIAVEWNTTLVSFTQDDAAVHATLERAGVSEKCDFAYLAGCDGAHSRVREALRLGFPGGTYEHLYYVADTKLRGGSLDDGFNVSIGRNSFALRLPVRSSGMQRIIGIAPDHAGHDLTFEDVRPTAEKLLGVTVEDVNWFSTYHVHHRVADHFRVGRCFVAGDAGHVHSPAGGQGMNTGIGDAVNLSWKLAHVLQGRAAPALLDTYEQERIVFARKLVATTDRAFQSMVSDSLGSRLLRGWIVPHVIPFVTGFSAARRGIFETVSQIRIDYEASALSEGHAGDVHGGDRLPWVAGGAGGNFDALRSLDWQLHVYGSASREVEQEADALGIKLHAFAWSEAADKAGLHRDALYLVRPDGYVALASRDIGGLRPFAERRGLRFKAEATADS